MSASIVPINPPMTASDILSEFKFLSTMDAFKVALPVSDFSFSAKSGFVIADVLSEMLNGIVSANSAFVESALNTAFDVIIEYRFADVLVSNLNPPS